ncbi:hypothetical protein MIR68_008520 [Amoeboaphelidium protococcarum]|nr:hypothetical protein MIR68_008520 [Amoeboaphelidium protococcarum]KAI3643181.1 hypothetical protein MP228_012736 [Amoeboaphelidium protococcarum]KAI3644295.1 hypothetical protein MP228_010459 [Amoeboaphelidium protococcarum]
MSKQLKSSGNRPVDYDGSAPNVPTKTQENTETPAFAQVKLRSGSRPVDYDGSAPNIQPKNSASGNDAKQYDVKLKKVGQ